jgi:hypothetical protein
MSRVIIRGHVFDAGTGRPLRKAQVRVFAPELRENRLATTVATSSKTSSRVGLN